MTLISYKKYSLVSFLNSTFSRFVLFILKIRFESRLILLGTSITLLIVVLFQEEFSNVTDIF